MGNFTISSTEEFLQIIKDKNLWNDNHDYSLVNYINLNIPIIIINEDGFKFKVIPYNFLYKKHKLGIRNVINKTEYLVSIFKKIHGDKYDYSLVLFINNKIKVKIICQKHGMFEQAIGCHLSGQDCSRCSHVTNTEDFIEKANKIHNNKYTYPDEYINAITKINICCPIHGNFLQSPNYHLNGDGCSKCGGNYKPTTEEFLQKLKDKGYLDEGNIYYGCDFSKFIYKGYNKKGTIIDKYGFEHSIIPDSIIFGAELTMVSVIDKTNYFIYKVIKKYGNYYSYLSLKYIRDNIKVIVTCPKHGDFLVKASAHLLNYQGCVSCSKTGFDSNKPAYFYVYKLIKDDKVSVGYGISNKFNNRDRQHKSTFKKYGVRQILLSNYYFERGIDALNVETIIKRHPNNIDFGIPGFRTECVTIETDEYILEELNKTNGVLITFNINENTTHHHPII